MATMNSNQENLYQEVLKFFKREQTTRQSL